MRVLGIESSCDETACAVYAQGEGLLSHALYSQLATHRDYGGVVPELASRDHVRKLLPLLDEALAGAGIERGDLDGVAYTAGPGLTGALLVGAVAGRSLAWTLGIPSVAVHHMEGHLLAPMLEPDPPGFPFVALLVSGGHTLLVSVRGVGVYDVLGETLDDAAGEAFDKTAKLLGLPYPGGPAIAKLAESGDPERFDFPRPLLKRPGLDFSFSGLKTHVRLAWERSDQSRTTRADVAAGFQAAVVETLTRKCERAIRQTGAQTLVVAGGVGANRALRGHLKRAGAAAGFAVHYPRLEFCTDNGAMIAYAGLLRLRGGADQPLAVRTRARWPLTELTPP